MWTTTRGDDGRDCDGDGGCRDYDGGDQGRNLWGVRGEGGTGPLFLGGGPQVVHFRPPFITIILLLFYYYLGKVHLNSFYHNF